MFVDLEKHSPEDIKGEQAPCLFPEVYKKKKVSPPALRADNIHALMERIPYSIIRSLVNSLLASIRM